MDKIPYIAPNDFDREYLYTADKMLCRSKVFNKPIISKEMWKEILESKGRYSTSSSVHNAPVYDSIVEPPKKKYSSPTSSDNYKEHLGILIQHISWLVNCTCNDLHHIEKLHNNAVDIMDIPMLKNDNSMFLQELCDSTCLHNGSGVMFKVDQVLFIAENFIIYVEKMIKEGKIEMGEPIFEESDYNFEYKWDKLFKSFTQLKAKKRDIRNGIRS